MHRRKGYSRGSEVRKMGKRGKHPLRSRCSHQFAHPTSSLATSPTLNTSPASCCTLTLTRTHNSPQTLAHDECQGVSFAAKLNRTSYTSPFHFTPPRTLKGLPEQAANWEKAAETRNPFSPRGGGLGCSSVQSFSLIITYSPHSSFRSSRPY